MRKNIILITIDCLRADRFAIKGADPKIAPYLNHLANKGQFFINAFSNGPYTYASFPSILSGVYALIHGGGEVLDPNIKTLAQFLSENGYFTVCINSNPYLSRKRNYDTGFDVFLDVAECSNKDNSFLILKKSKLWKNELFEGKLPYACGEQVNKTVDEILLQNEQKKSLFLWVHYMDLHVPFSPPMTILEKFLTDDLIEKNKHLYGPGSLVKNFTIQDKDILFDIYNACLQYCDICIENLLEEVLGPKMIKNSLVIITSDHGEAFYEHGRFGHFHSLYDELLSVPLLVFDPGLRSGITINQYVSLIDIPPTIADFIGVTHPEDWNGKSLLSFIVDAKVEEERIVYAGSKIRSEEHTSELQSH